MDLLEDFLADQPQSLSEIWRSIVESGELDEFVRKRVEDQLYFTSHDDAIYDRRGGG